MANNCTVIKSSGTITSEASEKVAELKSLIDAVEIPLIHPYTGDAILYDSNADKVISVNADNLTAEAYPASQFTPIGVVAVPKAHNVYGDNSCGIISLKHMSYSTPDEGALSAQDILWGNATQVTPKLYPVVAVMGDLDDAGDVVTGTANQSGIPSDNFDTERLCNQDSEATYSTAVNGVPASPSPYKGSSSRGELYIQTEEPSSEDNAFTDFDGKGNTESILSNVTVEDWKTASTISNSSSRGNYPAACCCWRFHTAGTEQGDWYLPSLGELGYVMARMKTINNTISAILSIYGDSVGATMPNYALKASTEPSASNMWTIYFNNGYVYAGYAKSSSYSSNGVRAVLRLAL